MNTHARRGAVLGCVLVAALPAASASASTYSISKDASGTHITYVAGAGEKNNVLLQRDSGGAYTLTDSGVTYITPSSDLSAVTTCFPVGNVLNCAGSPDEGFTVYLGDGDDEVDTILPGTVTAFGGPGADVGWGGSALTFDGGPGPDTIKGDTTMIYGPDEPGDLTLSSDGHANDGHAGEGDDIGIISDVEINADGNDTFTSGSQYRDVVTRSGGQGTTHFAGGPGPDRFTGGTGDDTIDGGGGQDTLDGRGGDDTIDGGDGIDTISGGDGDDHLSGGAGRDTIYGGPGNDTIDLRDGESDGLADCGDGSDTVLTDPIDTAWYACEEVGS